MAGLLSKAKKHSGLMGLLAGIPGAIDTANEFVFEKAPAFITDAAYNALSSQSKATLEATKILGKIAASKAAKTPVGKAANKILSYQMPGVVTGSPFDNPLINAETGPIAEALTVFHGSPYKFDAFDAAHIGKGEGAQAYGHGVYFAENPGVADDYATKLGNLSDVEFKNKKPETAAERLVAEKLTRALKSTQAANRSEILQKEYKDILFREKFGFPGKTGEEAKALADAARSLGEPSYMVENYVYDVHLPDELVPNMLDYDGILSEQPDVVQNIAKLWGMNPKGTGDIFGNEILKEAESRFGGSVGAADAFAARGVPGVKYLDGNSRGAGDGTRNYVVFPGMEKKVKILKRNNDPIK